MRHLFTAIVTATLLTALPPQPSASTSTLPPVVERYLPEARLVGTGTLEVLFIDVFDASLYTQSGRYSSEQPFALMLQYRRALKGRDIVRRTLKEMRRQGMQDDTRLSAWEASLMTIFPDVEQGTRLTGISDSNRHTVFYHEDQPIGRIEDPQFTARFFAIWLGEDTSEPGLRKQLLAGGQGGE